jgi:type I restriction enzyme S subunit
MKDLEIKIGNIFHDIDPSTWTDIKFGDFAQNIVTKVKPKPEDSDKYIGLEHLDSGSIHIHRWGTEIDLKGDKIQMRKGDVIFGKRNAYLRRASVAPFDGICSAHAMVLRPKAENIEPDFFPFFVNSDYFMDRAIMISVGSLSPTINWSTLAKEVFRLPPRPIQKKLVELLLATDQSEQKYRTATEKLHLMRKSVFGELTKIKTDRKELGKCIKLSKTKSIYPHKFEKYLGLEHLEPGVFTTSVYGDASLAKSTCNVFKSGQLLYSKLRPNLDKAIIASFDGVCSTELLVYEAMPGISLDYILHYLHSDNFIHYAVSQGFGTKMPRVSHKLVSEYKIYAPDLKEQEKILSDLKRLSTIDAQLSTSIQQARALRSAILDQTFQS